jgi:hypothetical protein
MSVGQTAGSSRGPGISWGEERAGEYASLIADRLADRHSTAAARAGRGRRSQQPTEGNGEREQ